VRTNEIEIWIIRKKAILEETLLLRKEVTERNKIGLLRSQCFMQNDQILPGEETLKIQKKMDCWK